MEKLRLQHLSSPRGSSPSFIPTLSSLLLRIRHTFRFRIALDDIHSTTLQVLQTINCSIQWTRISLRRISRIRCVYGIGENYTSIAARDRVKNTDFYFEKSNFYMNTISRVLLIQLSNF